MRSSFKKEQTLCRENLTYIICMCMYLYKYVSYVCIWIFKELTGIIYLQELLPLIMCAIERHPDSSTRDSLTHTLFNLIKRPDEQQRRIIMDVGC